MSFHGESAKSPREAVQASSGSSGSHGAVSPSSPSSSTSLSGPTELLERNTSLSSLGVSSSGEKVGATLHARVFDHHLWICSSPFFESVLLLQSSDGSPFSIDVFDADGALCNHISAQYCAGTLGVIELNHLLEGCKLEGGLKHAHIIVNGGAHGAVMCRIQGRESASVVGESPELSLDRSLFFPVTFCDERSYLVSFINLGDTPASARCRLFFGKRTPEVSIAIPPRGARLLSLNAEFSEFAGSANGKQLQSYVRLSTREQSHIGVQLIERCQLHGDRYLYSSIA